MSTNTVEVETSWSASLLAEPCAVILFGASGDLARRKVIPALYDLAAHNSLASRFGLIGFARTPMTDDTFRAAVEAPAKSISEVGPIDSERWKEFAANLFYCSGAYNVSQSLARRANRLAALDQPST